MFAQYWDKVEDTRDISGVSRFLSGGMGGITSQLCRCQSYVSRARIVNIVLAIYPIETLKVGLILSTSPPDLPHSIVLDTNDE